MDTIGMKVTDITSFKPNIKNFEEYDQKIEIWEHPRIWRLEDEDCYSDFFLQELNQIKEVLKVFVSEGYSKRYISIYEFSFLRKLAFNISKSKDFKESFLLANGWAGKLGLEFAKAQMKIFKKKFGRIPVLKGEGIKGINKACFKKYWEKWNIFSWNDLLREVFGEVNNEYKKYIGEKGLIKVKEELLLFFFNHDRLPKYDDGFAGLNHAFKSRYWEKWNINSWNDLLREVFGEVNNEYNYYKGKKGFDRVTDILINFHKENGRIPSVRDKEMGGIPSACTSGYYRDYGINCWNDLLLDMFGRVNKRHGVWVGLDGLNRAKKVLIKFYKENGRLPTSMDEGKAGIKLAITLGYYRDYGINCWNDLLLDVFGRVNLRYRIWVGRDGLNRAKEHIIQFYTENERIPKLNDKGMGGIVQACHEGRWKEFGINHWSDLLKDVFKEEYRGRYDYVGEKGLNKAKEEILNFFNIHARFPRRKDGLWGITHAIESKYWKKWNIKGWNDLLLEIFGKVNKLQGIWVGRDGLNRAKENLTQFYTENGRIPKSNDKGMGGIVYACYKGKWKDFGIKSWKDLKNSVF